MPLKAKNMITATFAVACIFLTACGGTEELANEATDTSESTESTEPAEEGNIADLTIPAEVAFAGQIAQSLLGTAITEQEQRCLFTSATDNEEFAEAISAVLNQNASLTPDYFKSLITSVRDCVGQQRMTDAIALGLSLNEQNDELNTCLNESFINDPTDAVFVGMAAITAGLAVPQELSTVTIDLLNECVPIEVIANQLTFQYEQIRSFTKTVNKECLLDELNNFDGIDKFWEAAFVSQDPSELEGISLLVEGCEEALFANLLQEIPNTFEPWSGKGTLASVAPPARNNAYLAPPPMTITDEVDYVATITTNDGEMTFQLLPEIAPLAVNNFVNLTKDGYYDGLIFHRVLENFMAQGGDPTGIGTGNPGYRFKDEVDEGTMFDQRGILAMANSGPDTNGSQFFITFTPTPHLDGNYTIFGTLIAGDDVLASIDLRDPANPTVRGEQILSITITEQ